MEKRATKIKLPPISRRNIVVAGEDRVTLVPLVGIVDRVDIEVPATVVPVDIHGARQQSFSCKKPSNPPPLRLSCDKI